MYPLKTMFAFNSCMCNYDRLLYLLVFDLHFHRTSTVAAADGLRFLPLGGMFAIKITLKLPWLHINFRNDQCKMWWFLHVTCWHVFVCLFACLFVCLLKTAAPLKCEPKFWHTWVGGSIQFPSFKKVLVFVTIIPSTYSRSIKIVIVKTLILRTTME